MRLKKSLSNYLVEFFVLFIAVFLGFIAENFRETISENKKESMLMKSLLNDLKADSTHLQSIIANNIIKMNALDSFINIRHLDLGQRSNLITFYERWKPTEMWSVLDFKPTMVTLNQLQSTGILSSTKQIITATIASYNVNLQYNNFGSENYYNHVEETFRMIYEMTDYITIWDTPPKYPPLQTNENTLMKFFNLSADLMWTIEGYIGTLNLVNTQISRLITLIEAEYNF